MESNRSFHRSLENGFHNQKIASSPAGIIERIQMKNFMCHDNLEVTLNPRINFVVGKNGSGKSAIQTAVAVGLGGKALSTNRGSAIKSLIKNGKNSCTITIILSNKGKLAYKPEVYGQSIKVERTFTASYQNYKIKNSSDKVVSSEKKELDRIVSHFNILTENPLCILHQDAARNFLNSSDPKKKYKFFVKASRLDDINKIYDEILYRINMLQDTINKKTTAMEEAFHDVREMHNKVAIMEEAKQKKEKCDLLEKEILWAEVAERKIDVLNLQNRLETVKSELKTSENKLKEIEDVSNNENMRKLQSQLEEIDNKVKYACEKLDAAKEVFMKKKENHNKCKLEFNEAKQCERLTKMKYDSCLLEIDKFLKNAPEMKQRQERLKEEKNELEKHLESLKAAEQSFEHDKQQLNDTIDVMRQNLQAVEQQYNNLKRQKGTKEAQIRDLSTSTSNLSIYGPNVLRIVNEIEKAAKQQKFKKKPLGPIGMYIKVRDPEWAGAVENYLGKSFLSSFCVDNDSDSKILTGIMKNVCSQGNQPPVICSKFLPQIHNIHPHETGTPQFSNLARALDIQNPVVTNCLIDQMEVETVLLIPSNEEAYQLLDEAHKVPKNCKRAFTLTGDQFIPAPNYKSYSATRPVTQPTLLHVQQEDLIRELSSEVIKLTELILKVELEKKSVQQQLGETSNTMNKNEKELRNLKKKRFDAEQRIRELEETIESEVQTTNIGYLEEESQTLKTQLEISSKKLQELKGELESKKEEYKEAECKVNTYQKIIAESNREKAPIEDKIQQLNNVILQATSKENMIKEQIKKHTQKINQIESEVQKAREKLNTATEVANQCCGVIKTERSKEDIEKEIKSLKTYLKTVEKENGSSLETLQKELKKRQEIYNNIKEELKSLLHALKESNEHLNERKEKQQLLMDRLIFMAENNFQIALVQRNFEGKLVFDREAETLDIKVSRPSHKTTAKLSKEKPLDTSSLSGGEKSFSTVCFILALWQNIELPFHFMDEFDVFMDGINRRTVIEILRSHAERSHEQFIFLTPLDTSSLPESDIINILRLEPPRQ